jgi:hypothetical protein
MKKRVVFRPDLIDFLLAHEGMVVKLDGIMRAMPDGAQESSVRHAMREIIEQGHFQITTLASGHSWRINGVQVTPSRATKGKPSVKAVGPLEIIGEMKDGSELARDNSTGKMYTLRAL